ncbi:carboxypeptidase N subunit 2 [Parasteatoda tepidariorum]|uniref:Leucine-rich repeat neuronal protein 2 n=1 Tax=Parasteatoda tepidariorum TaxID=114398 RepID=A0A2L2YCJ6_PARTP|nr:chondroadherin [Parasteatoda tepidariorum]XP_042904112.1 chondroadherin [Parasteatoda tepidariorum]XP_042904113.1 chondroadherin [Parasteatoda tepidariorum]
MHKLKGSPKIIVFLFYFLCLLRETSGMCPVRCQCNDDVLKVDCDSANLDGVPITLNPELQELRLSNNLIKTIRTYFNVYRNLEFLDLSINHIQTLDNDSFVDLRHLKIILLNRNMITTLQNDTFKGLGTLEVLHLNENYLQELSAKVFVQLENLETLDLSQNSISNIDPEAFFGLKKLKTLFLRDNKLANIPSTPFQYLSKLIKLDLGFNPLQNIPDGAFSVLNSLQELSLDGCGIRNIHLEAFKWLNSLLILRIQDNDLYEVPTKALYKVIRLEELNIGQNKFQELKAKSFDRLKYLHTIEINGCPLLNNIEKDTFSENTNLKTIIITHNKELKHLEDGTFDNLPNIQYVSFRGNSFESIPNNLLSWDELQVLDVRDNPLVCNCSLFWLWKLLVTKNFSASDGDTTQVVCANPPSLKGKVLSNLPHDDLDCYNIDAQRQLIIGLIVAASIAAAIFVVLGFRYRDKLSGVLKTKWGRKEPQYQKTCAEEESTILQAAQQSLKMTPVTEL